MDRFHSQAAMSKRTAAQTLDLLEEHEAREMLAHHLLWYSFDKRSQDDILISFTSSFLFAVQHGVRKIAMAKVPNTRMDKGTTDRNCFIAILDTQIFKSGTFHWTVDLLEEYGISDSGSFQLKYHKGEYLAEYSLDVAGHTRHVSFADLDSALYAIAPNLERYEDTASRAKAQFAIVLNAYRQKWWLEEEPVTDDDRSRAHKLAVCFGGKWYIPMAAWGLAMKNRTPESLEKQLNILLRTRDRSVLYRSKGGPRIPDAFREVEEWQKIMMTMRQCYIQLEQERLEKQQIEKDNLEKERVKEDTDDLVNRFGKIELGKLPQQATVYL